MFAPDTGYDLIPPATDQLLTDLGIDVNAVRETIADDLARRCPDREVCAHAVLADGELPDAIPPEGSGS